MALTWTFAFRNLGRNKKRNLATASAIVLGFAGLLLLSGFVLRIEKFFRATTVYLNHVGSVSVFKPEGVRKHLLQPAKFSLSLEEQEKVLATMKEVFPDAEFFGRHIDAFTLVGNGCKTYPVRVMGVDPDVERRIFSHPMVRKYSADLIKVTKGGGIWEYPNITPVSVSPKVARSVGKSVVYSDFPPSGKVASESLDCASSELDKLLNKDSNIQFASRTYENLMSAIDLDIVNQYASGFSLLEDAVATAPLSAVQKLLETDSVTHMAAYLPWDTSPRSAAKLLDDKLKEKGLNLEVRHYADFEVSPFYAGFMNLIYVMSTFFLGLTLMIVTLSVADTMAMSVMERSREIGTLRAIGFKAQEVDSLFLREAILLVAFCLPAGVIVAGLAAKVANRAKIYFEIPGISQPIQMVLNLNVWAAGILSLLLLVVTLAAAVVTSRRVCRKNVVYLLSTQAS